MSVRLRADWVLTPDGLIPDGVVEIDGSRLGYVGPAPPPSLVAVPAPEAAAPDRGDASEFRVGGLLMAGLVNAHAHTPMTLMRGAGDDLPLMRWLTEVMWPREGRMTADDAWWGMTLGSAEMLLAGVTTSCEMYLFEEAVIEAVVASGARVAMTPGVLSVLHADTFGAGQGRLAAIADVHARWNGAGGGRVSVGVAPHSAYDLGIDRCAELAELARSLDALLHIHLCETADEDAALRAEHGGRRTTALLADAGALDGKVLAAHAVWLDDDDLGLLAAHGTAVAHCPVSNMKLGSGVARIADMVANGITVGLGTDGPASNDTLDLWEEVKLAPLLARVTAVDPLALSAATSLAMATTGGAKALGLDRVGALAEGWAADVIRIDLDHPAFTPVTSPDELLAHVVWAGPSRRVTDVWVAGEHVVVGGTCATVDLDRARAEVQARGARLAAQSDT
jgi:5-methylthioadenosine/S-adenosylhomocysteine deaminase